MTTKKLHYFDFSKDARYSGVSTMSPVRALPASWYTSENMRWLFLTHSSPGFDILITRDSEGNVNASPKDQDNVLLVHVKIDVNGFIWINLGAKETPEVAWEEHFRDIDKQERHTYSIDGHYSWKILADNFNECYHFPNSYLLRQYLKDGHIQHRCVSTPEQMEMGLNTASTYYFPMTAMVVSSFKISYEIYRNKKSSEADFRLISDTYARVVGEDKALCIGAQKNLERNFFTNGALHPKYENTPIFFQSTVRQVITEHFDREKSEGHEIWPAKRSLPTNA
ncbi:hypothetical protein BDV36DRAFT_278954 [Aspergillus pseudocaelatus]|uniref:Uncharacterized protein n=1 Tax=Aspergillus pseudocaelatus TaxID=1825620 RepID=A0ABQ6X3V8_9EURO|nr:hypothetical protein BDV36DRAFT_278954 [Aspergillus pseudocaelatus]